MELKCSAAPEKKRWVAVVNGKTVSELHNRLTFRSEYLARKNALQYAGMLSEAMSKYLGVTPTIIAE